MTQNPSGPIGEVCRRGALLRERQMDWNALLALEAQDHTWLVDWSGGVLSVLCQSPVWISWLRRNEKNILKQWNSRFPKTPAQQITAAVRPWSYRLPQPAKIPKAPYISAGAAAALRAEADRLPQAIAVALKRLAATLDHLQAEAVVSASAKENGARLSE
ncbi:MAG: DciA family protein [Acidithiobacillus ferrivorans]